MKQWIITTLALTFFSAPLFAEDVWIDKLYRPTPLTDDALFSLYWKDRRALAHTGGDTALPMHYRRAAVAMKLPKETLDKLTEIWLKDRKGIQTEAETYRDTRDELLKKLEIEKQAGTQRTILLQTNKLRAHTKEGFLKIYKMDQELRTKLETGLAKGQAPIWRTHVIVEWSMLPFRHVMGKEQIAKLHEGCQKKRTNFSNATRKGYKSFVVTTWKIQDLIYDSLLTPIQKEKVKDRLWRVELRIEGENRKKQQQKKQIAVARKRKKQNKGNNKNKEPDSSDEEAPETNDSKPAPKTDTPEKTPEKTPETPGDKKADTSDDKKDKPKIGGW
ncbi:MAG: hypothetical protein HN909_09525 [Phycisphaerales bacterium]|jgi:hypothetical protein|nr:hypothetical protein [Phycisphaerales bacterium]MBT7171990.1 hypothetical protein [Phycisphaerales bacterium]